MEPVSYNPEMGDCKPQSVFRWQNDLFELVFFFLSYLFIFGSAGSLLPRGLFPSCGAHADLFLQAQA